MANGGTCAVALLPLATRAAGTRGRWGPPCILTGDHAHQLRVAALRDGVRPRGCGACDRVTRYCRASMDRHRPPIAWTLVIPVAAAELLLLVATANRYGYHRDELYFRVAGQHPAWGYDDQPALTPLIGRFSEWLFGEDPRGLRVMSAVAMALVVVLAALIARELGSGRMGQVVAALAVGASGGTMAVGHLLSTTTFDVLVWVTIVDPVARLLGGGDERRVAARRPRRRHRAREQAPRPVARRRSRCRVRRRAPLGARTDPLGVGRSGTRVRALGCRTCSGRRATAGPSSSSRARSERRTRSGTGSSSCRCRCS